MSNLAIRLSAGLFVPALFVAAWAVGVPQASNQVREEARSLKAVCARCHNLQIVMDTPKSYDAWHDTVQKMVNLGAKGTDEQYDDIMDYLHRTITTIDVNSADADELEIVLNASETVAQAIVARRRTKRFTGLADLKSISGVDASIVNKKARLIFFN
jgi:competence protein ComEA